jgi:hypothetical protein
MIMGMPSCKAVDPYLDCLISRHIFLNPSQVAVDPTGSELVSGVLKDSHSTAHSRPEALNLSNQSPPVGSDLFPELIHRLLHRSAAVTIHTN